jgi:amino acid transporter
VFVVVAPVLVYNFLGFELPSAAGEELRDPARDVPASIARAGALTCALYAVPVLAIVLVVPADRLTGLTGFIDALAASALATGWSAVALAAALWPGLGTGDPDAHLPDGFAGQRVAFTLAELLPLAAVLAAALLLARPGRHQQVPADQGVAP